MAKKTPPTQPPRGKKPQQKTRAPIEFPAAGGPVPAPPEFDSSCEAFGLSVSGDEREALGRFVGLLLAANERVNLTAIKDPADAWVRHVFDSLTLLGVLGELSPERVADVGAGGGLPTLPLAIGMPRTRFTAIEATGKKCAFIRHAAEELGLENVEVVNTRSEQAGRDKAMRDGFDVGLCRALGRLAVAAELVMPLVRVGGVGVFVKGERAGEELAEAEKAIGLLGCAHAGTFETPTGRLVVLEKEKPTARLYPRADGLPKREPLGMG